MKVRNIRVEGLGFKARNIRVRTTKGRARSAAVSVAPTVWG